jgi:hypothetical protein
VEQGGAALGRVPINPVARCDEATSALPLKRPRSCGSAICRDGPQAEVATDRSLGAMGACLKSKNSISRFVTSVAICSAVGPVQDVQFTLPDLTVQAA